MDRRSFISAALLTTLAAALAPGVARAADPRVDQLLARMSPAQKIALLRCDFPALAGLGIPALSIADASAGLRGETGVTAFPVPLAQAATFHPDLVGKLATAVAAEGRGKGFTNLLAPTADLTRTWHFGRQSEGFGEDPHLSGVLAAAAVKALRQGHVVATLKHFGAYTQELDRLVVDVKVDERTLHEVYHAPFRAAVEANALASVMLAYPKVNGTFAVQHPGLFDDLKRLLGLQGHTVPDFWAGDDQIAAANAGMDLAGLGPGGVRVSAEQLAAGVPAARIEDAARRILSSMFDAGLFDHPLPAPAPVVTTPAHQALAHEIATHATVLLSNRDSMLPLGPAVRSLAVIGVTGTGALTGVSGSSYVDPGAWTTPLQAIRDRAGSAVGVTTAPGTLGDVPLPVVPGTALPGGLTGTFYAGPKPVGTPVATQKVSTLDFSQPPVAGLPAVWSARWTGTLSPSVTGLHRFSLLASGTAKLVVGGKTVVSGIRHMKRFFLGPFDYPLQGTARLNAGQPVPITVEYTNSTGTPGEAALTLGWQPDSLIPAAVGTAAKADAAIVVVNRVAGEDMDHSTLALPGDQDDLIAAVAAANPNTVVVLNTDGAVAMPWLDSVRAVVQTWYGGRGMGTALAAVLFGDSDPAGRLPVTFPASAAQGPSGYPDIGQVVRFDEGVHVGYRYYDRAGQQPLFPFGHGLSYTTFVLGGLNLARTAGKVTATATLTNTGTRAGWQTVQLYAALPAAAAAEPRRLVGFRKVHLGPGQQTQVSITVPDRALSIWDTATHRFVLTPGLCTLSAGTSSRDLPVRRTITL
ncbi:glycoside hydrolase family 3 C-terminal domain-containing protein [Amycolatopsis magusensis]|uniref:glycoside hydrolase family 3 C-terminal domain-containing protein n=1 Tax=Amycolatopsis magusensis TaxID=882444 RepID=UPI0024A93441|nr:glycoside hydrolase family 3 C-terminal domain-containing protein [Amycolatopsis magusensis]MDI5975662.1 glycoside hydrolase family 3 C-terminal domain-containing protein [Amycolatopsis magusensis]